MKPIIQFHDITEMSLGKTTVFYRDGKVQFATRTLRIVGAEGMAHEFEIRLFGASQYALRMAVDHGFTADVKLDPTPSEEVAK